LGETLLSAVVDVQSGFLTSKPRILIIGAGIGGLTAAITLRQAGIDAHVFERAAELKEVGAGIGLSANAMRVLRHLGLMERVLQKGTIIEAVTTYTRTGQKIGSLRADLTDVPAVCLHRADLQQVLWSALPQDSVHFGEQFVEFEQNAHAIKCSFATGRNESGDALIGADGLRSAVRAQMIADGEPDYRGYQCWRGVCNRPASSVLTETLGAGIRVGVLPLGPRGSAWWCCANEVEEAKGERESAKNILLGWLGDWHQPIPEVIESTDPATIIKTGIYDRSPVRTWSQGRCTLLGDAAHPTTPNMAQGGGMAIEDAVMLARCLSKWRDPADAFRVYQQMRYARTASVTRISRYAGTIGQWKNPGALWFRNSLYRLASNRFSAKSYLKFLEYDPYKVPLNRC
jgi:2-polyprenyl-6-methoxyphenol hydroxylase-like FAD-dependent oxidoreductase